MWQYRLHVYLESFSAVFALVGFGAAMFCFGRERGGGRIGMIALSFGLFFLAMYEVVSKNPPGHYGG